MTDDEPLSAVKAMYKCASPELAPSSLLRLYILLHDEHDLALVAPLLSTAVLFSGAIPKLAIWPCDFFWSRHGDPLEQYSTLFSHFTLSRANYRSVSQLRVRVTNVLSIKLPPVSLKLYTFNSIHGMNPLLISRSSKGPRIDPGNGVI